MPRREAQRWTWGKAEKIVGTIDCEQEAMPCVYINAFELDSTGQVIAQYEETTRAHCQVVITFKYDDAFWAASFMDSVLQACVQAVQPTCEHTDLVIRDETQLLAALAKECGDWE
jgi:hypothetical protein